MATDPTDGPGNPGDPRDPRFEPPAEALEGDAGDPVELTNTSDPVKLAVIRSLLDDAEIPYLIQGENFQALFPVHAEGFFRGARGTAAIVRVRPEDLETARELLDELPEAELAPDDPADGAPDG